MHAEGSDALVGEKIANKLETLQGDMALLAKNQKEKAHIKRNKPLDADGLMDMLSKLTLPEGAGASGRAADKAAGAAHSGGAECAAENDTSDDEDSEDPEEEQPRQSALQGLFSGIMPAKAAPKKPAAQGTAGNRSSSAGSRGPETNSKANPLSAPGLAPSPPSRRIKQEDEQDDDDERDDVFFLDGRSKRTVESLQETTKQIEAEIISVNFNENLQHYGEKEAKKKLQDALKAKSKKISKIQTQISNARARVKAIAGENPKGAMGAVANSLITCLKMTESMTSLTELVSETDPFPEEVATAIAALRKPAGPEIGASYVEFHVKLCALQEMMRGKTTELFALLKRSSRHMKALRDGGYGEDTLQRVARDIVRDSAFDVLTKLKPPAGKSTGALAPGASPSSVDSGCETALLVSFAAAVQKIRDENDNDWLVRFSILGAICYLPSAQLLGLV